MWKKMNMNHSFRIPALAMILPAESLSHTVHLAFEEFLLVSLSVSIGFNDRAVFCTRSMTKSWFGRSPI
jgi:hypothetical protein